jgi:hypothetical protein
MHPTDSTNSGSQQPAKKLTQRDIDYIVRSLKADVKAAKARILSKAAGLKAAYEIQLNTIYPPDGDPVWNAAYAAAIRACEPHIKRVEERCAELGLGTRFRPSIYPPRWSYGDEQLFKDLRAERRRIAHAQIDEILKNDVTELEAKSSAAQKDIYINGLTDAAREFMAQLPTIDQLVRPLQVDELAALIEGKSLPIQTLTAQLNTLMAAKKAELKEHNDEE